MIVRKPASIRRSHVTRPASDRTDCSCSIGIERQKIFFSLSPHNPLKRLIPDERIQGNPSFSNTVSRVFHGSKRALPRDSNKRFQIRCEGAATAYFARLAI